MPDSSTPSPAVALAPLAAAELQDHLLTAMVDLDRLQSLLADACGELLLGFKEATAKLEPHAEATGSLGVAVTALQFEDMAMQLLTHTRHRLRHCADRLAGDAMPDGQGYVEEPPLRPNPVTQDEMHAGEIELF